MISRIVKWLRLFRARRRLGQRSSGPSSVGRNWLDSQLRFTELAEIASAGEPRLAPYVRLAAIYDDYAGRSCLHYDAYLRRLAEYREIPQASVLDLSCGSGCLVERLASRCQRVVGLDVNPHMLHYARQNCRHLPHVSLVEADYRQFSLAQRFDAVLCVSDSLNYVRSETELAATLQNIADHLVSGGLLVFDVLTDLAMATLDGNFLHYESPSDRFVLTTEFDRESGRTTTRVVFKDGVEYHERMAVNDSQVLPAAHAANLLLVERFNDVFGRRFFAFARD
jgi:SAM-dependent methyltransferase